jgi:predicted negative regulator of RcsB-dependent stress response
MIRICSVLTLIFFYLSAGAQIDYNKQYVNAKDLLRQGKYNLAMESFKPLIAYDKNNKYSEFASYFYALAAYKQGYKAVAKDMLNQLKSQYPKWEKMDEVNFLLARIHFDNHDYFQALKTLSFIQEKKFEKDIEAAKRNSLATVSDVETLRMMYEEYPKDEIIAARLAESLSKNLNGEDDRKQLESLIEKYKWKRADFFPEAPKTFHKDRYSVSVMLPFMVNTLEPTPGKKRNQVVLDFYEGMKLAVDTLNKEGATISLRAYDTEKNSDKLKRLLSTEELKNTDLIVGPFFAEENKPLQDFSIEHHVNMINPFTNNSEVINNNPYAFLFQPSSETLGRKTAEHLAARVTRKNAMVFYGPTKKDSVMAANFVKRGTEQGLNIVASERIANRDTKRILQILATPTEFDEFKYPSQFTLKKDSIGSIFVASDDALIYSEVVSGVETRGDSIRLVGSENWIDDTTLDPEKYQTLGIALTAPNFANTAKPAYHKFFRKFVHTYGKTPSPVARMGYEFMMLFGNQLKSNGVFFQDALSQTGIIPGFLFEGFNYQNSHNNELVPFITFQKGQLTLVEKR